MLCRAGEVNKPLLILGFIEGACCGSVSQGWVEEVGGGDDGGVGV